MMYSYGPPHMAELKQDDQREHTYSSYVRIRDVALKTCHGDDDDDLFYSSSYKKYSQAFRVDAIMLQHLKPSFCKFFYFTSSCLSKKNSFCVASTYR